MGRIATLALFLFLTRSTAAAQTIEELDQQIEELDGTIETVSTLQKLQEAIHTVKDHIRITDVIEKYSGDQASGMQFELEQIRDLLVKMDEESEETRMGKGVELGRKIHSAVSAVDAVLALGAGTQASATDRLKLMGQYIEALNDALGILGLAVNPVLDAMISVYAKALTSAAEVGEEVIEPRTAAVNEAIDAAGDALGSEDGAADEYGDLLDQLYDMRADLRKKRTELEGQNTDYLAARGNCLRTLGIDYDEVIDRENDVERARHELMDIAEDLAEAERSIPAAEAEIREKEVELENQQDRRRRGAIAPGARDPVTIQAEIDALKNNIRYAREKIRRLEEELRKNAPEYEAKLQAAMSFKDCVRSILAQYAAQSLEELPIQYRDCTFWDLPEGVVSAVAAARVATGGGGEGRVSTPLGEVNRPETQRDDWRPVEDVPPADGDRTGDVSPAPPTGDRGVPTGDENRRTGAATPAGGGGNTAIAMKSGPAADLVPTVEPIEFTIFPYLPEQGVTGVDLRTQTATGINFPITLSAGRDLKLQIVILSGPAIRTQTREPQSGQGQPTGTSLLGPEELVPGGGILFYDPDLKVFVQGLGTLGNDAVEMKIFGTDPGSPGQISAEGLVVEPVELTEEMKNRFEQELRSLAAQNPITAKLDAYCLDFLRQPPDLGTVFRVAGQEIQQQFAPLAKVLSAGQRLHEMGLLNPDSDPEEYFHSIRQWALWSVQESLDLGSFGDAFVEHTQKNFETAGQPWTEEVAGLVRSLVPNRWQDIAAIVEEARSSSEVSPEVGAE
ncbi:MAG TPA: hypothetical protein VEY33_00250 [Gemmatimonadota bacterium]|nr:hypothetical protein [Gemmatimonadota bacterium]